MAHWNLYYRKGDKTLLGIGNYQRDMQSVTLPSPCRKILLNNYPDMTAEGLTVTLHSYQILILEL